MLENIYFCITVYIFTDAYILFVYEYASIRCTILGDNARPADKSVAYGWYVTSPHFPCVYVRICFYPTDSI